MKTVLLHLLIVLSVNACSSTALGESTWEIYQAQLSPAEVADSPLKQKGLQALFNSEIKGTRLVVSDSLLRLGQVTARVRKITAEQILIETEEGQKAVRYRLSEDQQVCILLRRRHHVRRPAAFFRAGKLKRRPGLRKT